MQILENIKTIHFEKKYNNFIFICYNSLSNNKINYEKIN